MISFSLFAFDSASPCRHAADVYVAITPLRRLRPRYAAMITIISSRLLFAAARYVAATIFDYFRARHAADARRAGAGTCAPPCHAHFSRAIRLLTLLSRRLIIAMSHVMRHVARGVQRPYCHCCLMLLLMPPCSPLCLYGAFFIDDDRFRHMPAATCRLLPCRFFPMPLLMLAMP